MNAQDKPTGFWYPQTIQHLENSDNWCVCYLLCSSTPRGFSFYKFLHSKSILFSNSLLLTVKDQSNELRAWILSMPSYKIRYTQPCPRDNHKPIAHSRKQNQHHCLCRQAISASHFISHFTLFDGQIETTLPPQRLLSICLYKSKGLWKKAPMNVEQLCDMILI